MSRSRGFWWAPDSERLLVARVDDTPVQRWWIADPAHPGRAPQSVAYPAAGTDNAEVRLFVLGLDGVRTEVAWDRAGYPYLARVHWSAAGAPLILVQARDQRSQLILAVDPHTGATRMVHADEDPTWLELFPGVPCWSPSGQLVRIADEGAHGSSRSANARSPDRSCMCGRYLTSPPTTSWSRPGPGRARRSRRSARCTSTG